MAHPAPVVVALGRGPRRPLRRRRVDDRSLAALGCTTRQLVAADLALASMVVACGIVMAVGLAVAASPLFPVGPPRRIEAIGGLDSDVAALGLGGMLLMVTILAVVGIGSWRRRAMPVGGSPGRAPGLLGASPAAATGLRLITGRRGTRSMTAGVAAGLAGVVATLIFTGSLGHLVDDPTLVGMGWDVIAREGYTMLDIEAAGALGRAEPPIPRLSGLGYLDGEINGTKVPLAEVRSVVGDPWPPIVAGRAPGSPSEILVGRATMRALGVRIGTEVDILVSPSAFDIEEGTSPPPGRGRFTIVGSAVAPAICLDGFDCPRLDIGALVPQGTYQASFGLPLGPDVLLFDLAAGDTASFLRERFPDGLPDGFDTPTEWFTSAKPAEVTQAEDARRVIWLAVAALGIAIVATIAHTLLGFVRQRRRDYAVLKALGFTPGQIRTTVLTQSGAILAVALIAALPLGAAVGRGLWTAFASRIGVVVQPVIPVALLAAATLISIIAVQGAALIPATLARRTPAGQTLHGE